MAKSKSQQEKEAMQKRIAELEQKNQQFEKDNAELKKKSATSSDSIVPRLGKKKNDESVKQLKKLIKGALKHKFWRNLKYFPRKSKEEKMITTKIVVEVSDQIVGWDNMSSNQKEAFVLEALPLTASVLNDLRNYIISRIKKACEEWWTGHGKKLPSLDRVVACMKREIDPEKSADYEIMEWYWDNLLVKSVGNSNDWNAAKRYYSTISKAAPEEAPTQLYITEATEAFAVVTFDNCREAWLEQFKLKSTYKSKKTLQFAQPEAGETREFVEQGNKLILYSPKFRSKWTSMESGSSRHGGIDADGLAQFKQYRKEVKTARNDPTKQAVEEAFLKKLREKAGITMPSAALTAAEKKRKRDDDESNDDDEMELFEDGDFSDVDDF